MRWSERFYCLAFFLLLALTAGLVFPAGAADLSRRAVVAQPALAPTYTGFYAGVSFGGMFADRQTNFVTLPGMATGDVWPAGVSAGAVFGYTSNLGPALLSLEATFDYNFNAAGGQCGFVTQCEVKDSWLLTQGIWLSIPWSNLTGSTQALAGRLNVSPPSQWPIPINLPSSGWAASIAPKIGGGVAERNVKVSQIDSTGFVCGGCSTTAEDFLFGWWLGAGLDFPIASGWTASLEYKYIGFNKSFTPADSVAFFGPFAQDFSHLNVQKANITLKYLF